MICKDASKLTREALEDDWVGLHELVAELPAGARTDRHEIENLKAQMPEAARPSGPWACLWLRPVSWPGIAASVPASPRRPHDGDGGQGKSAGWIWSQCPEIGRGGGPAPKCCALSSGPKHGRSGDCISGNPENSGGENGRSTAQAGRI